MKLFSQSAQILLLLCIVVFATSCAKQNLNPPVVTTNVIRLASVQYPIEGSYSAEMFLQKMEKYIEDAKEGGAEIVLFPEWTTLDTWPIGSELSEREIVERVADRVTPSLIERQKDWSEEYELTIVTSSVRRQEEKLHVSAFVTTASGELFIQDKYYLTKWERDIGLHKGSKPIRIPFRDYHLAVVICYDVEFPDLSVDLMRDRPEILLVPAMTESEAGYQRVSRSARARAVEQTAYVVTSHTVGKTTETWQHFGQAELMAPQIAEFPVKELQGPWNEPGIVWMKLDMDLLQKMREESSWQPAKTIAQ